MYFNVGAFIDQNGGAILSPDGRHCLLDQPAAIESAAFYASLFHPRTIVAPQANGPVWFAEGVMTYGGARIALGLRWSSAAPAVEPGTPRRLYVSEPLHGKVQQAGLSLQGLLVMTSTVADAPSSFAVMAALAGELQRRLFVPATLSAAAVVDPRQQGLPLDAEEQAAILRTARYASYGGYGRYAGPDVASTIRTLEATLQRGQDPARACREATAAINAILHRVQRPGPG
jgi:ABC-type glycerol-3-phosphate transport system substrate-binding protein